MRYHRGYVKCNGKKAVEKFKDVPDHGLRSLEQATGCESYAGILAPGIVLLDFDLREHSNKAYEIVTRLNLNCRIYESDKGYHFLFRATDRFDKSATRIRLACGLTCDIKLGTKNSYEVLKLDGHEREMVQDSEDPDEVPGFLSPMDSDVELLGLGEGDGRNDILYRYILAMQGRGFGREEITDTLHVINRFVFNDPMPESEMRSILREDAFKPDIEVIPDFMDEKGRFLFHIFAQWLMDKYHIIMIDDRIHIYDNGIYVPGATKIEKEMIKHIPELTAAKRKETYEYMVLLANGDTPRADARYIAFRNGVYDIVEDRLMPFSPDIVLTNIIPHDYDPSADDQLLMTTLRKLSCGNQTLVDVMCEMLGYIMYRRNELGISFFLLGNKANGKSTFIDLVSYTIGEQNISALDLGDLARDFKSQELAGKLLNAGDDISDAYISDTSVFKKVATGNVLTANPKYEQPFKFSPYCKLLFSANVMPRMNDKTNAAARRILPIPFKATFSKSDPDYDPYISYKLKSESVASTFINFGIAGLRRVLEDYAFSSCEEIEAELTEIQETNNPVLLFMREQEVANGMVNDLFIQYTYWCANANCKPLNRSGFVSQVESQGYTMVASDLGGRTMEIFIKEDR